MTKRLILSALVLAVATTASAKDPDKRLATVRKAVVVAADELGEDRMVAACLREHLHDQLPIEVVDSKDDADVVLTVSAHVPSATSRVLWGGLGGSPSAYLVAKLPDGTVLWEDGAKLRRAIGRFGKLETADGIKGVECGLADELADTMRSAMRQARGR